MFQGLRQGNLFYILEKGEDMCLKTGQVISVSNPHPKMNQFGYGANYHNPQDLYVDVKVKVGDESIDFMQLDANLNIANSGNVIVSDNKDSMIAEVEGMLCGSRQIIESVPYHENVISACDAILRELNPKFAKEKEQEEKIGVLEVKMDGIESTLNNMMGMLSKALNKNNFKTKEE